MKRSLPALIISVALFVAWLTYLGIQAWQYRKPPIIVSRSQLLAAQYDATANLQPDKDGRIDTRVKVLEVLFAADKEGPQQGQEIDVQNLGDCNGYQGPGTYVLPLVKRGIVYQVTVPPLDPGVSAYRSFPPTIYLLNDQVRKQFQDIRAGKGD